MNDLADSHLRRRLFDDFYFNFVGKPRNKLECFSWPHFNVLFRYTPFSSFYLFIYLFIYLFFKYCHHGNTRQRHLGLVLVGAAQWCVKTAVLIWVAKSPRESPQHTTERWNCILSGWLGRRYFFFSSLPRGQKLVSVCPCLFEGGGGGGG